MRSRLGLEIVDGRSHSAEILGPELNACLLAVLNNYRPQGRVRGGRGGRQLFDVFG